MQYLVPPIETSNLNHPQPKHTVHCSIPENHDFAAAVRGDSRGLAPNGKGRDWSSSPTLSDTNPHLRSSWICLLHINEGLSQWSLLLTGGPQRPGVDPLLSSSRACLTAFIAFSVSFVSVSLGQFHPVLLPHAPESGKGWLWSIGFGTLSPGHRTGLSPGHGVHSMLHDAIYCPTGMLATRPPTLRTANPGSCRAWGGGGAKVNRAGRCHRPWLYFRALEMKNPQWVRVGVVCHSSG